VGSFEFPYLGGTLIAVYGIDVAMLVMAGLVALNIAIASQTLWRAV
jgi:hypothetical protein